MINQWTSIFWNLNNFCKAQCSYCPSKFWGGEEPRHISEYIHKADVLIKHFKNLNRNINWSFSGGEPLDMFDFPEFLKFCKTTECKIKLTTNGGRIWLDWWAIEPYIDELQLSYHYWQNPNLIKYIIQLFRKNNKFIEIIVPIRPDFFDNDFNRAIEIEKEFHLVTSKYVLYKEADIVAGMFPYTDDQLRFIRGEKLIEEKIQFERTTFKERVEDKINVSPSFTGKFCNTGIETLYISHDGWMSGSACNNTHLGNIWQESFQLPTTPSKCKMLACTNLSDQKITKFDF